MPCSFSAVVLSWDHHTLLTYLLDIVNKLCLHVSMHLFIVVLSMVRFLVVMIRFVIKTSFPLCISTSGTEVHV